MSYSLLTDAQILKDLADRFDLERRIKSIKDRDLVEQGGTSRFVLNKFRKGDGITLTSFIRLLRGLGELDRLESLFDGEAPYSPTGRAGTPPRRVRGAAAPKSGFKWGEDA